MRPRWCGLAGHLEGDTLFPNSRGLLVGANPTAIKITFVERHKKAQARLNGRRFLVQFVTV